MATYLDIFVRVFNQSGQGINQATQSIARLQLSATGLQRSFRAATLAVTAFGGAAALLGRSAIDKLAQFENTTLQISAFTGGVKQAQQTVASLTKEFGTTGFSLQAVNENFARLAASGVTDVTRTLRNMVDAVSAAGGSTETLNRLGIGLSQVAGKGKLQMEELRQQIGEAVPFAMKAMAEGANQSLAQFTQRVTTGAVDSKEALEDFNKGIEKMVGGFSKIPSLQKSIAGIGVAFDTAFLNLSTNTDITQRLTIVFQDLAEAIYKTISNISQKDIDDFWASLEKLWDVGTRLFDIFTQLYDILKKVGVLWVIDITFKVFDKAITGLDELLAILRGDFGKLAEIAGKDENKEVVIDISGNGTGGSVEERAAALKKQQVEAAQRVADAVAAVTKNADNTIPPTQQMLDNFSQVKETLDVITERLSGMEASGDSFATASAKIRTEYEKIDKQLDKQIASLVEEQEAHVDIGDQLERAYELRRKNKEVEEQLLEQARQRYSLESQLLKIQTLQVQENVRRAQRDINRDVGGFEAGLFDSDLLREAQDQYDRLTDTIMDANNAIFELQKKRIGATEEETAQINAQIDAYRELIATAEEGKNKTSAASIAQRDLAKQISDIQKQATSDLLFNIATTGEFGDIATDVYHKITRAVSDYIAELIEAYIKQQMMKSLDSSGGGGGFFGLFSSAAGAAANGYVGKGNIQPFANGGIVRGPTMFGLMGEAGTEAIMPLTRIGGKLGVHAGGQGGDQYHITIQAIDAQSSAQFIQKNGDQFTKAIRQKTRLNKGLNRS